MMISSIIIQLFGIPFLGITFTEHDIEFDYVYNWDIVGSGGWYLGYSEVSAQLTDEFIVLRMTYNEDGSMNNVDRYAKTIRKAEADLEFSKRMQNKCN